jgi:signal transduction histidine kinase
MGLFLAQRIIRDRYNGTLELADREGGGTLARVEIGARSDD